MSKCRQVIWSLCLLTVVSCGGDAGSADGARSTLCENITGGEAILWDLYNGVFRTDSVLPPPLPPVGGSFSHPSNPLLGFIYPPGWVPQTIDGGIHNLGVNLIRQDQQAIWREQTQTLNTVPAARDARDFEIQQLLQFFGLQAAQVQTVCANEGTAQGGGGIVSAFSNILLRAGDQTAVIATSVTPFPGLPNASMRAKVVAAPTAEFSTRAIDTFLAIDWQLLIGDSQNLFDRDGDGWRDGVDEFPDDPTRH